MGIRWCNKSRYFLLDLQDLILGFHVINCPFAMTDIILIHRHWKTQSYVVIIPCAHIALANGTYHIDGLVQEKRSLVNKDIRRKRILISNHKKSCSVICVNCPISLKKIGTKNDSDTVMLCAAFPMISQRLGNSEISFGQTKFHKIWDWYAFQTDMLLRLSDW